MKIRHALIVYARDLEEKEVVYDNYSILNR